MGNNLDVTVKAGDQALPFIYAYSIHNGETKAQMIAIYYGAAKVKVGDTEYAVDMMDGDSDGNFGGAKDGWTLRPAAEPVKRPESEYGMTVGKEKRFADGKLFTLAVGKGKVTLTWSAAEGPDPATLASQRERAEKAWAERFAPEKEGFVKARGMDTSRPLAETPIHWNYVTLAKAKAMAKKADKPLFVDVMAFWCVWCYRMDFYTYPDKAVADLLNNDFIPVKIIQEQDQAGDYSTLMKELGARGIPAMGIWSADGDLVKYISGWSKPSDFETTLKTALEKAKAPKEEAGEKDGESGDSK
jgi:thioredoxin-related protein